MPPKKKAASASPFDGLTFCVSGDFSRSQNELKELIIQSGGHISATPSKACDFLVADQIGSSKTVKAQKDGLPIVTEAWVDASIKAGKPVTEAKHYLSGHSGSSSSSSASKKKPAAAAATKAKGKRKAKDEEEDEEEEEEEEEAPTKKQKTTKGAKATATAKGGKAKATKAASAASSKKKGKKAKEEEEEEEEEDEAMDESEDDAAAVASAPSPAPAAASSSSSGPVSRKPDREVPGRDAYTIVDDFACLLNQTNITGGRNNNKFYVIQLLRGAGSSHFVWTRWGRVGEPGQSKLDPCGDFASAVKAFESKFKDKTKNTWSGRSNFVKHADKYELVEMDEGGDGADGDAPLGKLSKGQIEKGQAVLASLRTVLENGKSGKKGEGISELSARYYTLIPTVVGRQVAPAISSLTSLLEKEELLKFMLRMGFDEVDKEDAGLSPIDGITELALPKSLLEAALGITNQSEIKNADEKGKNLASTQVGNPVKKMDASLYAAIMLYTSNAIYAQLNQALREEKRQKIKQYFRYLRLFLEAFSTLPAQNVTLWRGLSVDVSAAYSVGSEQCWWGVSSCTSDENVARNFMSSCGGKTTLLIIKAQTACDISLMSFFPHEKESLLAPGTKVKVLSKKVVGTVTEITVEEVGQAFARS